MTKKDYIVLAKALKQANFDSIQATTEASIGFNFAVLRLMDVLQEDNNRFDKSKFVKAISI